MSDPMWMWVFLFWCGITTLCVLTVYLVFNHMDKRLSQMQQVIDNLADDMVDTWLSLSPQQQDDIVNRKNRRKETEHGA